MFWKVIGGIALFFMAVVLTVGMVAAAGVAVVGAAVGSVVDNIDTGTVLLTDENGNTEIYSVQDLLTEAGRVEIIGDNGERVTIEMPQITVQEQGRDGAQVILDGESSLVIDGPGSVVQFDGRNVEEIENIQRNHRHGSFLGHLIGGFISGMFKLTFWGLVVFGAYLVLRKREPVIVEKAPPAE